MPAGHFLDLPRWLQWAAKFKNITLRKQEKPIEFLWSHICLLHSIKSDWLWPVPIHIHLQKTETLTYFLASKQKRLFLFGPMACKLPYAHLIQRCCFECLQSMVRSVENRELSPIFFFVEKDFINSNGTCMFQEKSGWSFGTPVVVPLAPLLSPYAKSWQQNANWLQRPPLNKEHLRERRMRRLQCIHIGNHT